MGMNPFGRVTRDDAWTWAAAMLVSNIVIVFTGGMVRLTGSGLGCPTWPRCTDKSFVPHKELGYHSAIEFGNRLLTYVLVAIAIGAVFAIWRWAGASGKARTLVLIVALGIPFQAVIGGITVLTDLNPWIVALHFMLSMALIAGSINLVYEVSDAPEHDVGPANRILLTTVYALVWIAVYVGTIVTGSGPHAGDQLSPRNDLDPAWLSAIHSWIVWALVALTIVLVVRLRRSSARYWALAILGVELLQGVIGYIQFFQGLPIGWVAAHMVGAAILIAVSTRATVALRP